MARCSIVMPFVEGESLRARLDRESQLPIDDAIGVTVAVAKGLETGPSLGTPQYMSPEQATGDRGVDARGRAVAASAVAYGDTPGGHR